jgi:hypothetical protein
MQLKHPTTHNHINQFTVCPQRHATVGKAKAAASLPRAPRCIAQTAAAVATAPALKIACCESASNGEKPLAQRRSNSAVTAPYSCVSVNSSGACARLMLASPVVEGGGGGGAMSMRLKGGPLQRRHATLCNPPFLNAIVAVPSLDTFAATASTFFNRSRMLAMSLAFTTKSPPAAGGAGARLPTGLRVGARPPLPTAADMALRREGARGAAAAELLAGGGGKEGGGGGGGGAEEEGGGGHAGAAVLGTAVCTTLPPAANATASAAAAEAAAAAAAAATAASGFA